MLKPIKRNKIVPFKIDVKLLCDNRHLFTDDVHYNSLIISNLINQSINLIDVNVYDNLDIKHKIKLYESNTVSLNYILVKDGLYILVEDTYNLDSMIPLKDCFIAWEDCDIDAQYIYILTIVNEE